jgi:hypothetical protein
LEAGPLPGSYPCVFARAASPDAESAPESWLPSWVSARAVSLSASSGESEEVPAWVASSVSSISLDNVQRYHAGDLMDLSRWTSKLGGRRWRRDMAVADHFFPTIPVNNSQPKKSKDTGDRQPHKETQDHHAPTPGMERLESGSTGVI